MTTPTREQVIEQAIQGHAGTRAAMQWLYDYAYAAGRAQALDEAENGALSSVEGFGADSEWATGYVQGVKDCADGIQALKGKQCPTPQK